MKTWSYSIFERSLAVRSSLACDVIMATCKIVIVLIITTLFQEHNIFGTNASLTYDPQLI